MTLPTLDLCINSSDKIAIRSASKFSLCRLHVHEVLSQPNLVKGVMRKVDLSAVVSAEQHLPG